MKKSKEQLQAELVVADLIKNLTPAELQKKVATLKNERKYAIAQRVTVTIMLAVMWDLYDDFNEEMMKQVYEMYNDYHEQYARGTGHIYEMMLAVDELLNHELLDPKMFEVVRTIKENNDRYFEIHKDDN